MRPVVIAPASFKGSLPAHAVARIMAAALRREWPRAAVRLCPMADGGEGSLRALAGPLHARLRVATVPGADGRPQRAHYAIARDGRAVIESAQVIGLTLPGCARVSVADRSSYGLGVLLRRLVADGARRLVVTLGGSGTNDGGAGLLCALGARLLDARGRALPPTPRGLRRLAVLDLDGLDANLRACEITALVDVDAPLTGARGATYTFGPQKGVKRGERAAFDAALARLARLAHAERFARGAGAGAAGGLGFALALLGARLVPGAEFIARATGLDEALAGAAFVLTGEGCSDAQTLRGKAPWVVAAHARGARVPAVLVSGAVDPRVFAALRRRFYDCVATRPPRVGEADTLRHARALLSAAVRRFARAAPDTLIP